MGRLDPKSGRVTTYKLPDSNGYAVSTHGAGVDLKGNIWFTNQTDRQMLKFDIKSETFQRFPWPDQVDVQTPSSGAIEGRGAGGVGRVVNAIEVDSKGNLWTPASDGAARLNPQTGVYTQYKSITKGGSIYGIAVDAEDNAWIAQLGADRLMVVNGRTGEVGEVALPPVEGVGARDREIAERVGSGTNAGALTMKGPRRLGADKNGTDVWVAEYWSGQVAKIDIHTKKVTEYKVPSRYSHPYDIVVDKNHMVWICLLNSDRIAKFNPFTEQFTEYPLPTLGTNVRFIDIDNSRDVPAVWLPYSGMNKIARVEFRTHAASGAPKQQARDER
jgi:streptogramin lyase